MNNPIKAPAAVLTAAFVLSGCVGGLLDVDNPNALVEESVQQEAAANGVVNGALRLVGEAFGDVIEAPAVVSDELFWIGSRDAWGALDQGFISDNANEFSDAAFPNLAQGTWMAQNAVEVLKTHVDNNPGNAAFAVDYGRALMYRGLILMLVAEQQDDMTFSHKIFDGPPVSSGNAEIGNPELDAAARSCGASCGLPTMSAVMDLAIFSLEQAKSSFASLSESELELDATALLARAEMSQEIIAARSNPCDGTVADCALDFADAVPHALEVIADGDTDYRFNIVYSAASTDCNMCGNVNQRKENQIDLSLVTVTAANDVNGIRLQDVVGGGDDLALTAMLNQFKGGDLTTAGDQYPDLTVSSARLAHMILAESAAAGNGATGGTFVSHINDLRDIDGYATAYAGGNEVATLIHHRRVNTLLMGLRLQDMYRWGIAAGDDPNTITAATWASASDAASRPGSMLPIAIIEERANCHLNEAGCGG